MGRGQERAYGVLRQRLVGGHYAPGFHLREEALAREFGVSRTPVRAALRRLIEDGLATADAGQGVHVAEWSEADVEETFRIRLLLEPYATELAVSRGGNELADRLDAANVTMANAIGEGGDDAIASIQATNRAFHQTLLAFSGSPRMRAILGGMIDMPVVVRSFFLYSPGELTQSLNHHRDIALAARMRDGELGRDAMRLHLRMSYARVLRHRGRWRHMAAAGTGPAAQNDDPEIVQGTEQ